jgi:hypothetical protein
MCPFYKGFHRITIAARTGKDYPVPRNPVAIRVAIPDRADEVLSSRLPSSGADPGAPLGGEQEQKLIGSRTQPFLKVRPFQPHIPRDLELPLGVFEAVGERSMDRGSRRIS